MDPLGAQIVVEKLLRQWPQKAAELLVRYCRDPMIYNEMATYLIHQSQGDAQPGTLSPSNSLNITLGPRPLASSTDSQRSGSPPIRERLPHRSSTGARPFPPLSPPSTSPSVTSNTSKDDIPPGEYIFLLTSIEGPIKKHIVQMRTAPIKHSVMREDFVRKRNLAAILSQGEETLLSLPYPSAPNAFTQFTVSCYASLEWRRPHSSRTHYTTFFIVPEQMLDVDVLLGYDDAGESSSDFPPTVAPHPKRPQGFAFEYNQSMRPPAPTPPAPSYHRSNVTYDRSSSATPVQQPHHQFVENLMARQQAHGAAVEASRISQHSPASTALCSRTSRIDRSHPNHPSASGHNVEHNTGADKLRLSFEWGLTPMAMWLDLHAPGEDFFKTFQRLVEKRKGIFDRTNITIYLKKDKLTPSDEAYPLSLDVDDLEADWDTTVAWLQDNKRDKSPHVYGTVLSEGG